MAPKDLPVFQHAGTGIAVLIQVLNVSRAKVRFDEDTSVLVQVCHCRRRAVSSKFSRVSFPKSFPTHGVKPGSRSKTPKLGKLFFSQPAFQTKITGPNKSKQTPQQGLQSEHANVLRRFDFTIPCKHLFV